MFIIGDLSTAQLRSFNGTIDEVRIYNRALSPEEINASYNAGIYDYTTTSQTHRRHIHLHSLCSGP